jgi:Domain of unknown function (DUF1707)
MATEWNVRVSDADRDAVAAQLREHYTQGRLTLDELHERLDRTFASRTRTDLAAVTSDLPYAAPAGVLPSDDAGRRSSGPRGRGDRGRNRREWAGSSWGGPQGGHDHGYGHRPSPAAFLRIIPVLLALWVSFLVVGALGLGFGRGPSALALVLAVLAAVRWLFRRRRGWLGRSCSRPGRPRSRW